MNTHAMLEHILSAQCQAQLRMSLTPANLESLDDAIDAASTLHASDLHLQLDR